MGWRKLAFVGLVCAAVLVAFGLIMMHASSAPYPEAATIGRGADTFDTLSGRFADLARSKGGVYAYDVLRVAQLPSGTDTHLLGHVIGEMLYKQKGIDGIADCTHEFRNACSHAIVIGALNEFGTGAKTLSMIDAACKKAPGGIGAYTMCYHGLGHGIFAYYGYDLPQTVALCKKTGTSAHNDEQYTQCVGGSIMELFGGGGHDHEAWLAARSKYLNERRPLAPCDTALIPAEAKPYCYMYITPQLFATAGSDPASPDPQTFPLAFSYCRAIAKSETRNRASCFEGFGKEFLGIVAGHDIRGMDKLDDSQYARAAAWCEAADVQDGKESCIRQGVASVFWGGENDPAGAFRYCASTPQDLTDACFRDLGEHINYYLAGDSKAAWCARLPEAYRAACEEPSAVTAPVTAQP